MIIPIYPGLMITLDIDDFYANLFFNGIIVTRRPHYHLHFIYCCIRVACRGRTGYHENNFEDWDRLKIISSVPCSARSLSFEQFNEIILYVPIFCMFTHD